jgi:hypothetical protein
MNQLLKKLPSNRGEDSNNLTASGVKGYQEGSRLHSHHQIQGRDIIIKWTVIDINTIYKNQLLI